MATVSFRGQKQALLPFCLPFTIPARLQWLLQVGGALLTWTCLQS